MEIILKILIEFFSALIKVFKKIVIYVKNLFISLNYIMQNVTNIFYVENASKVTMRII